MAYESSRDAWSQKAGDPLGPIVRSVLITPHDTNELADYPPAICAGSEGTIRLVPILNVDASNVMDWPCQAGDIIPVAARIVKDTGTDVDPIYGVWPRNP